MNAEAWPAAFAKLFDHSIVRPDAATADVLDVETAVGLRTATVTVQPYYVQLAAEVARGSGVLVGSVAGFPHGNDLPHVKEHQVAAVRALGAEEIDMVMNIPALKNGDEAVFRQDVRGVVQAAVGIRIKVITENCYLTPDEKAGLADGSPNQALTS